MGTKDFRKASLRIPTKAKVGDLEAEDVTSIQQVISAYCHLVDCGRGFDFSQLFGEGGRLTMGQTVIEGRPRLEEFADGVPIRVPGVRHVISTVWVSEDEEKDGAVASAYLLLYKLDGNPPCMVAAGTGIYRFALSRNNGVWHLEDVQVELDS
jgi:hypothetical protein